MTTFRLEVVVSHNIITTLIDQDFNWRWTENLCLQS